MEFKTCIWILSLYLFTLVRFSLLSLTAAEDPESENVTTAWRFQSTLNSWGGYHGTWSKMHMCPEGLFATTVRSQIEPIQAIGDDTCLNSVQMTCSPMNEKTLEPSKIFGELGRFGEWSGARECLEGFTGFAVKMDNRPENIDDCAVVAVKFTCGEDPPNVVGIEIPYGEWGVITYCPFRMAICGIKTRNEYRSMDGDNTALNDIEIQCCGIPRPKNTHVVFSPSFTYVVRGVWGVMEECYPSSRVITIRTRTEPENTNYRSGVKSMDMICGHSHTNRTAMHTVKDLHSTQGHVGNWSEWEHCNSGFTGFQYFIKYGTDIVDEYAVVEIVFACDSKYPFIRKSQYVELRMPPQNCMPSHYICGFQTRVSWQEGYDGDSSLFGLAIKCCKFS